jgi:DNA-binding NtrC family response regulator
MPRKLSPDKLVLRLLESTPTSVYLLDHERRIAFVNPACEAWLGEPAGSLLGRPCGDLAPPAEVFSGEPPVGFVASPSDGGRVRSARFEILAMDGSAESAFVLAIVSGQAVTTVAVSDAGAADARHLHAQLIELRAGWRKRYRSVPFIGVSSVSRRIEAQIHLAAAGADRVLVAGPAGSGREHVVRMIHFSQVGEAGPLVTVDCKLLDAELMQQALAAYIKKHPAGKTRNGAILLRDVDRLSATAQHELVEFLRLPGVELTIRATATRSLLRLAKHGRFQTDLAHALSTLTIALPALKDRPEDIPLLSQHFVEQANSGSSAPQFSGFSVDALDELAAYPWPGNVSELAEVVQECCGRAAGPYILPADLPERFRHARSAAAHPPRAIENIQLDDYLAGIERELLERALAVAKGNKTKAATLLGIHRTRLIRRLVQLGIIAPTSFGPATEGSDEAVVFEPHPDET